MTPTKISSQRYIDPAIVAAKQTNRDYAVTLSPAFSVDGETYQVVMDGHHSLAAALADGVDPEYAVADASDSDRVALLVAGEIDDFLEICRMDSDWYDISTGRDVW